MQSYLVAPGTKFLQIMTNAWQSSRYTLHEFYMNLIAETLDMANPYFYHVFLKNKWCKLSPTVINNFLRREEFDEGQLRTKSIWSKYSLLVQLLNDRERSTASQCFVHKICNHTQDWYDQLAGHNSYRLPELEIC